jgi:hypothetical protein
MGRYGIPVRFSTGESIVGSIVTAVLCTIEGDSAVAFFAQLEDIHGLEFVDW